MGPNSSNSDPEESLVRITEPPPRPEVVGHADAGERPPPLGHRADPVFPSLRESSPDYLPPGEDEPVQAAAVPLAQNIFTLTPRAMSSDAADLLEGVASAPLDRDLGPFDAPEKDRVFDITTEFFQGHVRRIAKGYAIRNPGPLFCVGTVVISQDPIPTTHLRHARFQWAISNGRVVELKNARLPVAHLEPMALADQPPFDTYHRGDDSDLAFLLAYVCALLGIKPGSPIAATGTIGLHQNHILREPDLDVLLEAAHIGGMHTVVLPFGNGKVNGVHDGVRYWPVRDSNEAVCSLLSDLADEVIVPNVARRALTKSAYSWCSLLFMLAAICGFQLAVAFGAHPPVTFVRYLLGVVALLVVGSLVCTHRFWRLDR